jgi:hypothetical protein
MNKSVKNLVLNIADGKKLLQSGVSPTDLVYVGRMEKFGKEFGTPKCDFGNPFNVKELKSRSKAIAKYTVWLSDPKRSSLVKKIMRLKGKKLVCHCASKRCHGEVIALIANGHFTPQELATKVVDHFSSKESK